MTRYRGLDVLRGFGIFGLLILHSAFYYFDGLYSIDFDNPPVIITVIGFFLMFAGLFAVISGFVHVMSIENELDQGVPIHKVRNKRFAAAAFIGVTAYLYFLFFGPGLVHFESNSMNNSLLVELIQTGKAEGLNLERVLYIDSLVMIAMNLLLLALVYPLFVRIKANNARTLGLLALGWMLLSLLRIPLYGVYLDAVQQGQWGLTLVLNWLVNKNNPILPYFAFCLLGGSLALSYKQGKTKHLLPMGALLFVLGLAAYIFLPDTMLERGIDLVWYAIMVAQLGLFTILIVAANTIFRKPTGRLALIERFGYMGLTAFFFESVLAALMNRILEALAGPIILDIGGALLYGFAMALTWALILFVLEKLKLRVQLEYLYSALVSRFAPSTKLSRLLANDQATPSKAKID